MRKIIILLVFLNITVLANSQILDVPYRNDYGGCGDWCWAKTAQMLLIYYGNNVELCDVLQMRYTTRDCCSDPLGNCCGSVGKYYSYYLDKFGLPNTEKPQPLSLTEVTNYLLHDSPFIIANRTHVFVGYGRSGNDIYVHETGGGSYIVDYDDLISGNWIRRWTKTITMNTTANSCPHTQDIIGSLNSATSTYKATNRINASCIIHATSEIIFKSGNDVELKGGFEVRTGGVLNIETGSVTCP